MEDRKLKNIEYIEKFLHNELTEEELKKFRSERAMNPELNEKVELHGQVEKAVQQEDIMNLRAHLQDIAGRREEPEKKDDVFVLSEELSSFIRPGQPFSSLDTREMKAGMPLLHMFRHNRTFKEKVHQYVPAPAEGTEKFVRHLDNPLSRDPELEPDIRSAIREEDILQLREQLSLIDEVFKQEKRKKRSMFMPFSRSKAAILSMAASVVIIFCLNGIINRNNEPTDLYERFYHLYQASTTTRSGHGDNGMQLALNQFNDGNYDEALRLFEELRKKDAGNPAINFYSGIACEEKGRFKEAITFYRQVIEEKHNLFVEQAEWYSGLCFLKTSNQQAYDQFSKIAEKNGYYSRQAAALLKKMEPH